MSDVQNMGDTSTRVHENAFELQERYVAGLVEIIDNYESYNFYTFSNKLITLCSIGFMIAKSKEQVVRQGLASVDVNTLESFIKVLTPLNNQERLPNKSKEIINNLIAALASSIPHINDFVLQINHQSLLKIFKIYFKKFYNLEIPKILSRPSAEA
jgi:hypothetical protein